jgi:hypothetical protein
VKERVGCVTAVSETKLAIELRLTLLDAPTKLLSVFYVCGNDLHRQETEVESCCFAYSPDVNWLQTNVIMETPMKLSIRPFILQESVRDSGFFSLSYTLHLL